MSLFSKLPYDPTKLPRELTPFYISASDKELDDMLACLDGANKLEDLFSHLPKNVLGMEKETIGRPLKYEELIENLESISQKNNIRTCFIGDGLKWNEVPQTTGPICDIRGLTTAYTPYQPERSQGTLQTLWLYSSTLSMLTGFEAINASFYERSTCLYEALNTGLRINKKRSVTLVSKALYPGDLEVLETLSKETKTKIDWIEFNKETGKTCPKSLKEKLNQYADQVAAVAFAQVNHLGVLEDFDLLTDITKADGALSIGLFDPMHLSSNGLKEPAKWGSEQAGVDMIVGEGQHLALGPNFGGPGLGIFGIRYNPQNKLNIRSTAGRYIGKAKDEKGNDCLAMVLSTREQHIRREKATSNICSNQSFVASIAGAGILSRGENGFNNSFETAHKNLKHALETILNLEGIELRFKESTSIDEVAIKLPVKANDLIEKAIQSDLHIGVSLQDRLNEDNVLMMYFNDSHKPEDIDKLCNFFLKEFKKSDSSLKLNQIPSEAKRIQPVGLPNLSNQEIISYYQELGEQNVSPDDNIYPLGSCTMKYNPYINDWAASLPGFTDIHPQAPIQDAQGNLEILFEIQEQFKSITGLPGLTTQPVAGAQGELVGLKLFQAYHAAKGEAEQRNIVLIPKSAHGTNPATATMAGFETKLVDGQKMGIITIDALANGQMNFDQLKELIAQYGKRISGIMVTNPNTSGIFENQFKEMAQLIHDVDALVYMDGANMNAIAGWVNLEKMGVDAVHNNLHKTWTIPHGGGGPGDAIVAVSEKLLPYLPGKQVIKTQNGLELETPQKSIGSFHRHYGNFAHKVRAYTYIRALGDEGVRKMAGVAVLSARYLYEKLKSSYPTLPAGGEDVERMHEFIITINKETFEKLEAAGTPKAQAMAKIGKLFLDFGLHAPTVAFPEQFGLMIEPTESFTREELDRFVDILGAINQVLQETPEVLTTAPHFTPVRKVDEVGANKALTLWEPIKAFGPVRKNIVNPGELKTQNVGNILKDIFQAHKDS